MTALTGRGGVLGNRYGRNKQGQVLGIPMYPGKGYSFSLVKPPAELNKK